MTVKLTDCSHDSSFCKKVKWDSAESIDIDYMTEKTLLACTCTETKTCDFAVLFQVASSVLPSFLLLRDLLRYSCLVYARDFSSLMFGLYYRATMWLKFSLASVVKDFLFLLPTKCKFIGYTADELITLDLLQSSGRCGGHLKSRWIRTVTLFKESVWQLRNGQKKNDNWHL